MVDEFIERIRGELGDRLLAVWLYGSRARGERHEGSDIDLLVLLDVDAAKQDMPVFEAAADINLAHGRYPLSVRTRDLDWLHGRREIESFFVQEVDRDKVVLFGGVS